MKSPLCLFAVALLLAACNATPIPATKAASTPVLPPNTIIIDNFTFSPPTLNVAPGTTITWINHDDVPHTVTSSRDPRTLNSPVLDTDATYTATLTAPGTYDYYCTVHPHMTATIIVKEKEASSN